MAGFEVRSYPLSHGQRLAWAKQLAIVIGASAVIAVCARLVLPLPFTPVPLTLANFGVLLVWGAIGLPVFSPAGAGGVAQLFGPTGGYLLAYPVVAFIAGWISERGAASFSRNLAGGFIAELVLFASGIAWLQVMTGSWQRAVAFGLAPFLFAEIMKVMLAAAGARKLQRSV